MQDNSGLAGGEGWLNQLSGAHDFVVTETMDWLSRVDNPLAVQSAGAVARTVQHYRETDSKHAADLDAKLPANGSLRQVLDPVWQFHLESYSGRPPFDDVLDPQKAYAPIPDYNTYEDYQYQPSWYDRVSVAGLGRQAIWRATEFMATVGWIERAYDPYDLALKPVVGDWAGFRGCADMFRNLAEALQTMSGNLHRSQTSMSEVWRGNAADSCHVHLGRIRLALADTQPALVGIADRYQEAADGQAEFRVVVAQLLDDLIDAAIILVAAVAAGTVTAKTLVGPIIAGVVGIREAGRIVRAIRTILDWWARIDAVISGVRSAMDSFGQMQASEYHLPRLPEITGGHSTLDHLPSER